MELNKFVNDFQSQFIDADELSLTPETAFRTLESWDSLTGMSIIVMIKDIYDVDISTEVFKSCATVNDLFKIVSNKI